MGKLNLSRFDLSHEVKTSFPLGKLIPIHWLDLVPGDKIQCKTSSLIRMHPLIAPVMHRLDYYVRYYYVPYRLLVEDYTKILSNPDDPREMPNLYTYLNDKGLLDQDGNFSLNFVSLLTYFGINSSTGKIPASVLQEISALPFLAYQLIYNFYYKDPLLDESYKDVFEISDFSELGDITRVHNVLWFQDYFTSSKTSTQYGIAVDIDLDGNNTVKVTELRLAEMLQKFKEKLLETGNKYIDFMKEFFGTYPRDFAVQRPLYLGGFSSSLNISDVDQMAPSATDPLGSQAGKSLSVIGDKGYIITPDEHGIVLGLAFVKPRQSYIKGVPRAFIKKDFYSFFNPLFSNIGMQPTYRTELDASVPTTSEPFGYNERYAELKSIPDVCCSSFTEDLQYWHFARDIREESLSKDFLECKPSLAPFAYVGFTDISTLHCLVYTKTYRKGLSDSESFTDSYCVFLPKEKKKSFLEYISSQGGIIKEIGFHNLRLTDKTTMYYTAGSSDMSVISSTTYPSWILSTNSIYLYSNYYGLAFYNDNYSDIIDVKLDDESFRVLSICFNSDSDKQSSLSYALSKKKFLGQNRWSELSEIMESKKEQILSVHYHEVDALRPLPKDPNILY